MGAARLIAVKASGAVSANGNSATFTNRDSRGIAFVVANTAGSGTSPTVTVKLQEYYPAAAAWVDVAGATTTAIAAGTPATTTVVVYPGVTVAANAAVSRPLAKTWRIAWTIGGSATPTATFSVDAALLP